MINKKQAEELRKLLGVSQNTQDLLGRFRMFGYTNFSADEVQELLKRGQASLDNFITSITEKEEKNMAEFDYGLETDESFKLKPTAQTYEVSVPQLQKLFAKELSVPESRITIKADYTESSTDVPSFSGLIVTVKGE